MSLGVGSMAMRVARSMVSPRRADRGVPRGIDRWSPTLPARRLPRALAPDWCVARSAAPAAAAAHRRARGGARFKPESRHRRSPARMDLAGDRDDVWRVSTLPDGPWPTSGCSCDRGSTRIFPLDPLATLRERGGPSRRKSWPLTRQRYWPPQLNMAQHCNSAPSLMNHRALSSWGAGVAGPRYRVLRLGWSSARLGSRGEAGGTVCRPFLRRAPLASKSAGTCVRCPPAALTGRAF